jgi:uncharacterized damage-inducible protein DinB
MMMQSFFMDYLTLLEKRHQNILEALEGLRSEALDWKPGADMNSLSVLVTHLTGAERYWIGDVAAQQSSHRDREAEFRVHDLGMDALKQRLADTLEYARSALNNFTVDELAVQHNTKDGESFTVAWALLHALEHTTLHLGQIQLTRQLWEQANLSD